MSTVEGVQYRGGKSQLLFEYPTLLNTLHGTHDIPPHASWYPPTVLKFQRMVSPHGTEHPPRYSWYPSTVLMISPHMHHDIPPRYWTSPTVLKITPHGTHDIPHGTEHPPRYSRYPHIYHDIPHGTEHPHGTQDIPHGTHDIPPRYWTPPRYCTHIIQGGEDWQKAVFCQRTDHRNCNGFKTWLRQRDLRMEL